MIDVDVKILRGHARTKRRHLHGDGIHPTSIQSLLHLPTFPGKFAQFIEKRRKKPQSLGLTSDVCTEGICLNCCSSLCIAAAMQFMERKKVMHRDLSCRNCLVREEEKQYIIKLADFGLSVFVENSQSISSENTPIPVRWAAPEVYLERKVLLT